MIFEMTEEVRKHLKIIDGEMHLIDDDPELLKMNDDYKKEYGEELFIREREDGINRNSRE